MAEGLLIDGCGEIIIPEVNYDPLTEYLISQYELANNPQQRRIYEAWDYVIKALKDNTLLDFRLPYTVETTGETIEVPELDGHTVRAILLPNGTLTPSQYTQDVTSITYTDNSFYAGDNIVFIF